MDVQRVVRAVLVMAAMLLVAVSAAAQPQEREPQPGPDVNELPVSVPRVERELQRPQAISLEVTEPLFRVEIVATRPRWLTEVDWLGTEDRIGPDVPYPSVHQQYLARVTPQLAQPFHAFEGSQLLQVAITSFLQGLATRQITNTLKDELRRRREAAAEREVDEAIERWRQQLEEQRRRQNPEE